MILFVLLPFALAAVIFPLVAWRSRGQPKPVLISEILAHGQPGRARIVAVKNLGNVVDLRPMVRFTLQVEAQGTDPAFELEVIQSLPRSLIAEYKPGEVVEVRLTDDRTAGAVVPGSARPA
ncbi:MAG: hypothetical protein JO337_00205 [Acidimicrobiales bacterium]|nr:hypothetical protein [Acidimicrobiales bacterium]